jgi:hypothetical protein
MIHVFGDSFSEDYKKIIGQSPKSSYAEQYVEYLGRDFKMYTDLLSEHLNVPIVNHSIGGICNEHIFMLFMEIYPKIKSDDIVVFGWTDLGRFLVPHESIHFNKGWISNIFPNNFLSEQTTREVVIMMDHKSYVKKQLDLIKFIDGILSNNTTIHWTWVTTVQENLLSIKNETNGAVQDFHYGEKGHEFLFKQIIEQLSFTNRVRINLWDQFNTRK